MNKSELQDSISKIKSQEEDNSLAYKIVETAVDEASDLVKEFIQKFDSIIKDKEDYFKKEIASQRYSENYDIVNEDLREEEAEDYADEEVKFERSLYQTKTDLIEQLIENFEEEIQDYFKKLK